MRWSWSPPRARLLAWTLALAVVALTPGCPDKKLKYPACKKDQDCNEGEKCVDGKCQQCATKDDCGPGKICEGGECKLAPGACETDADCAEGRVCEQNRCVPCESDVDCGPSGRCSGGACLERGTCRVDEDCEDDEDCVDGSCQRLGRGKPPDVDCELATVYFGFDTSGIEGEAREQLNQNAECIQKAPDRNVLIAGHTDPRGTEEYNIALSEQRARSVADYLARLGIDPARFRVIPKGETESTGVDEDSWKLDRKVGFDWQ
jgi:peptidoglycan-associated lipoprotein